MARLNVDIITQSLESGFVHASFDVANDILNTNGFKPNTLFVSSGLRVLEGQAAHISRVGSYGSEGVIYFPGAGSKLVRVSPALYATREITSAHSRWEEFYPSNELIEASLTDSTEFPQRQIEISTNRLNSDDLAVFAFGAGDARKAGKYGDFLESVGIESIPIQPEALNHVNAGKRPFVRQVWFGRIDSEARSGVYAFHRDLNYGKHYGGNCLRGFRELSTKT